MLRLEDFRHIVPDETLAEIYAKARRLYGKHIVHLNATYQGGGVAEILYSLVLLMNDAGIDAEFPHPVDPSGVRPCTPASMRSLHRRVRTSVTTSPNSSIGETR